MAEVTTVMLDLHPGLLLIAGGLLAAVLPGRLRQAVMLGAPLLALAGILNLQAGTRWTYPFINNLNLVYLRVDKLSWIFTFVLCLITLLGNVYALHVQKKGEICAGLLYAGSSLGVVLAGDWITLIIFWEMMAVTSTFLIWYKGSRDAVQAGFRYILVHFFGGNLLLAGIFLKVTAGQPQVAVLTGANDLPSWLILAGIAVNAAIPPLHAWLTDAYPEATITGTVFMNAFTTKVAVYCLIRVFPGLPLLLWVGVIMAFYGVVYAVLENNIRRLLSYHIISQLGIMIAGVGIGTELALNGAAALAIGNIFYKSLLFMSAGAVIFATGRYKLTDLGGFYRRMPLNVMFFTIGALAISGAPLLNGFISKSMVISSAAYNQMPVSELLLYMASIGTFLSIALKLEYFMFFGPDKGIEPVRVPVNMYVAMTGVTLICFLYGIFPQLLYQKLPHPVSYHPYTLDHVVSNIQLLTSAFVAFWLLVPKLKTKLTISLDTDWVYRKPLAWLIRGIVGLVCRIRDEFGKQGNALLEGVLPFFRNPLRWLPPALEVPVGVVKPGDTGADRGAVYHEDSYRFPAGTTVLLSLLVFVLAVSYVWLS